MHRKHKGAHNKYEKGSHDRLHARTKDLQLATRSQARNEALLILSKFRMRTCVQHFDHDATMLKSNAICKMLTVRSASTLVSTASKAYRRPQLERPIRPWRKACSVRNQRSTSWLRRKGAEVNETAERRSIAIYACSSARSINCTFSMRCSRANPLAAPD